MAISVLPLTPVQFAALHDFITQEIQVSDTTNALAQSGLQYVVDLDGTDAVQPSVDLLNPWYAHYNSIGNQANLQSAFSAIVIAMNQHIISRGTVYPTDGTTDSERMNTWLADNAVNVSAEYARISSGTGVIITHIA